MTLTRRGDPPDDPATEGLQAYVVGGAVRDALLGLPAGDRDWVVVGATPEDMARRGFVPVGGDFPVFLHPVTKEEYALARTERKSGRGYQGFTFYTGADVTLEQDLQRRDFTINAMARTREGVLIDPLRGQDDLRARVFRHVGAAFAEDPVRILRLARFMARFTDFDVADETMVLCRRMVEAGEADALVPERVWKEVSRGLMAAKPSRMLNVLARSGALARVMPELQEGGGGDADVGLDQGLNQGQDQVLDQVLDLGQFLNRELDRAAALNLPLPARYALLCRHCEQRAALAKRLRVPADCADHARLLPVLLDGLPNAADAAGRLVLIEQCDALRKPDRFMALLQAASATGVIVDATAWQHWVDAARGVDAGAIAQACAGDPARIKPALREARLRVLAEDSGTPLTRGRN